MKSFDLVAVILFYESVSEVFEEVEHILVDVLKVLQDSF